MTWRAGYLRQAESDYSLLDAAERIEDLAPVGGNHDKLNSEYPWRDSSGAIQVPVDYTFTEFTTTDLAKMQTLVSALFRIAGKI